MNPQTHGQQLLHSLYRRLLRRESLRAQWILEPLPPRRLFAVTPVGGETLINTSIISGVQQAPDVAKNDAGSLAVWENVGSTDLEPRIAIRADGKYVITWQNAGDIFARLFNSDGTPVTAAFSVANFPTGTQQRPDISMRPTGEFMIVWDGQGTGDADGIFARRFNADATAAASQFLVNVGATNNPQHTPAVAVNDDGSFMITWTDDDSGGRIAGNYYNTSYVGSGVFAIETSGAPDDTSVASDGNGNFAVAYSMQDSGDKVIKYRRYNGATAVDGGGVTLDGIDNVDVQRTSVAMDSSGNFIATWDSSGRDGSGWGIYARRVLAGGTLDGSTFRVNTTTSGDQQTPSIGMTPSGTVTIVWAGNGPGDSDGIFSQQYTTSTTTNQSPVHSVPSAQSTPEDTAKVFSTANGNAISISDPDAGSSAIKVSLASTNGVVTLASLSGLTFVAGDGVADTSMTITGTIAAINTALNGLGFTPTADFSGSASLSITTDDQGATGTGGALSDSDSISINVIAVNDAPVNTLPPQQTVSGGGLFNFGGGSGTPFSVFDVDAGSSPLQVTLTASVGTMTLTTTTGLTFTTGDGNADATMTFTGSQTAINTALDGMSYNPPTLLLSNPTIDITTNDQGNTGSGGALSDNDTLSLNADLSNRAPVLTLPSSQSMSEDGNLIFSSGSNNAISIVDIDAGSGELEVTLTGSNGKLTLSGTTGLTFTVGDGNADTTMAFSATLANINNALQGLIFTPSTNFAGSGSVQVSVDDQGNAGTGGARTDSGTVAVTVNGVNDAPTLTVPAGGTLNEDSSFVFSAGNGSAITVADIDSGSSAIELTLAASGGTMTLAGTTGLTFVTGNGTSDSTIVVRGAVANLNAALNGMSFTPPANSSGNGGINVSVNDLGNSGSGGALVDSAALSLTIDAVNDAPVNSVASAQTTAEDMALVFSLANGNEFKINDSDAGAGDQFQVALTSTNGTLTLASLAGLTFVGGDGTADASMTFSGTFADVNTALQGLTFTPNANFHGAASITIVTDDQGQTGSGGAKTDSDAVAITVASVNDAPVNTVPGAQSTNEDVELEFSSANGTTINATDLDASLLRVTLETTNGALSLADYGGLTFLDGDGSANETMTFEGAPTAIAQALNGAVFIPAPDYHGVTTIKIITRDLGQSGAGGTQTDTDTFTVTVNSINDPPQIIGPSAQSIKVGTTLTFGTSRGNRIGFSDPDVGSNPLTVAMSVGVGTLTLGSTTGLAFLAGDGSTDAAMTFSGTISAINNALEGLIFAPPAGQLAVTNLQLTANDQGRSGAGGVRSSSSSVRLEVVNEFRANTSLPNTQQLPALAMNAAGRYVVVWTSNHSNAGNYGIYAQRYDELGTALGAEIHVNVTTLNAQTSPSIGIDDAGNFVVTWSSNGQDGSGWGIYARKFNSFGTAITGELLINQTTTGNQAESSTASATDGKFLVTWTSDPGGTSRADVFARLYNADGTPAGNEFRVNTNLVDFQYQPSAAIDASGQFVVAWRSNRQDGSGAGVFARRFDASGTALGGEFQVNIAASGDQDKPSIATAADGSFVVTWAGAKGQDGNGRGVYARLFDPTGAARSTEFLVNVTTLGNQDYPSVAMEAGGNFVISWSTAGQDGSGKAIYARRYDAAGAALTGEFPVNGTTFGNQDQPAAGISSIGSMAIVWQGPGYGDSFGVFGQFYRTANVVPTAQTSPEDMPLVFATARGNAISVTGNGPLLVTLSITHGTLTLASLVGLTFVAGDGADDSLISFEGSTDDINAALNGLRFDPTAEYFGAAQLTVMTSSTGGEMLSDLDAVDIIVTPVNDAPTLVVNLGPTIDAGQSVIVTSAMLELADIDSATAELIYVLTSAPSGGMLMLNGTALSVGDSFTQADVNNGLVTYTQNGAATSDGFQFTPGDGTTNVATSNFAIAITQPPPVTPIPTPDPAPEVQTPPTLPPVLNVTPPALIPDLDTTSDTETDTGAGGGGEGESLATIPQSSTGSGGGSGSAATGNGNAQAAQPPQPAEAPAPVAPVAPAEPVQAPVAPPALVNRGDAGAIAPFDAGNAPTPVAVSTVAPASVAPPVPVPPAAQPVAFIAQPDGVMAEKLDQIQEQIKEEAQTLRLAAGTASFVSLGLSVVYILWTVRAGYLLASLLSAMPAWSYVDPLPILDSFNTNEQKRRRDGGEDDDGESLQTLVNSQTPEPEVTS